MLLAESATMYIGFDHTSVDLGYNGPCHVDYYGRIVPNHAMGTHRFPQKANSEREIGTGILSLYDDPKRVNRTLLIRRIGLCTNKVTPDDGMLQLDLFVDHRKEEREQKIRHTMLEIKARYGKNAVLRGMNYLEGATMRERNLQIGGRRA